MKTPSDRRQHPRRGAEGLGIVIGHHFHPVVDISEGGVSFEGADLPVGKMLIAELAEAARPGLGELVVVRVRESAGGTVHAEFTSTDARAIPQVVGDARPSDGLRRPDRKIRGSRPQTAGRPLFY